MTQIMKVRWVVGWVVVFTLVAAIGYAQEPPIRRLSIADALRIARDNNPDFRTVLNDRWGASAAERSSFLNLFTPSVTASAGQRHTQQGSTVVTGFPQPIQSPASTGSSWNLSGFYTLSGSTIANRGLATANAGCVTGNESVRSSWIGSGAGTPSAWNSASVWFSTAWSAVSRFTSAVPLSTSELRTSISVAWPTW